MGKKIHMSQNLFNNIGISAISISAVLQHFQNEGLSLPKAMLIMPIVTSSDLLNYIAKKNVATKSVEKLIIENPEYFSNFNNRFYDSLPASINGLQLLINIDSVTMQDGSIFVRNNLNYEISMGDRAKKIFSAAQNIATILDASDENLYLNLRVEL
jgi:hypothetical protein